MADVKHYGVTFNADYVSKLTPKQWEKECKETNPFQGNIADPLEKAQAEKDVYDKCLEAIKPKQEVKETTPPEQPVTDEVKN